MRLHHRKVVTGFTLIEIMVVVAIIGFVLALAIPNLQNARTKAARNVCIGNLMQLEAAKQRWATDLGKEKTSVPAMAELIGPTLYLKQIPLCPAGGNYTLGDIVTPPTCTLTNSGHILN